MSSFRQDYKANLPFSYDEKSSIDEIQDSYKTIMKYYNTLVSIDDEAKEYNKLEKLFELQISKYKEISECKNDLKALKTLWDAISMVNFQYNDWKSRSWR